VIADARHRRQLASSRYSSLLHPRSDSGAFPQKLWQLCRERALVFQHKFGVVKSLREKRVLKNDKTKQQNKNLVFANSVKDSIKALARELAPPGAVNGSHISAQSTRPFLCTSHNCGSHLDKTT
jgi:hypothetical protein